MTLLLLLEGDNGGAVVRPKLLSNMNYFCLSQNHIKKQQQQVPLCKVKSFTGRNCGVYAAAVNRCHECKKIVMCNLLAKHLWEGESGKG